MISFLLLIIGIFVSSLPSSGAAFLLPCLQHNGWLMATRTTSTSNPSSTFLFQSDLTAEPQDLEDRLIEMARKIKLEVVDGLPALNTLDNQYGLEVIKTRIDHVDKGGLGLVLTELAGVGLSGGRGLVLVSEVTGNAAHAVPSIHVGDAITWVIAGDDYRGRATGLNYERTVEIIGEAKQAMTDGSISLELNRLVQRASIQVEIEDGSGTPKVFDVLAGENLRRLLLRKKINMYDPDTKQFEMPFGQGDCGGEGRCQTCLVDVTEGAELLNPKDTLEQRVTKSRPSSWRQACQTVVGANNKPGTLKLNVNP